jgi:hypothetical protein
MTNGFYSRLDETWGSGQGFWNFSRNFSRNRRGDSDSILESRLLDATPTPRTRVTVPPGFPPKLRDALGTDSMKSYF